MLQRGDCVYRDDLAMIARTSINAPNQYDADHAIFHRVKDFRQLALNLTPELHP